MPTPVGESMLSQAMELRAAIELRIERPENGDAINAMIREANRREAAVRIQAAYRSELSTPRLSVFQADALLAELGRVDGT